MASINNVQNDKFLLQFKTVARPEKIKALNKPYPTKDITHHKFT